MSFMKLVISALFVSVFLLGSVFAQTATLSGKVYILEESGDQTPVEGAKVTCYRTDIKQGCRDTTTNSRGEFVLAGIPLVAKVVLSVSGAELSPTVYPEIPATSAQATKIEIQVDRGDGREPSEDEVREIASRSTSGPLTAEQKAEAERLEKERLAIMEKNKNIEARNELRLRLLKEGEAAFNSNEFDLAIAKFDEGYKTDPEYVGSAPVFLNNKASSLKKRAVDVFNAAAKTKDGTKINAAKIKVASDFKDCLTAALKAHQLASNAPPEEIFNPENNKKNIKLSEDIVKDSFRILGIVNINLAGYVGTMEEANASVQLYKSSLEILPDNPDVLAGLMFALYMSSSFSGEPAMKQDSLNYGAYYLTKAPQDHAQREAVSEIVELIKGEGLKAQAIN